MNDVEMWWLSLAIGGAVVVVVAILLGSIIAAAKNVDRHAHQIWIAGKQIAGNTVSIWMLDRTIRKLNTMTGTVRTLERTAGSMEETLRQIPQTEQRD